MPTDIEKLEDIYSRLYEVSSQITELIERELYTELVKYFAKKEQLLGEAEEIIPKIDPVQVTEKFKETADKYQKQEKINLEALSKIKEETRKELANTTKNVKLVGAYRQNRELTKGNILDFFE